MHFLKGFDQLAVGALAFLPDGIESLHTLDNVYVPALRPVYAFVRAWL